MSLLVPLFCATFELIFFCGRYYRRSKFSLGLTGGDAYYYCDPAQEWARSADFLLHNGVAISGTKAYQSIVQASSQSTLFPSLPVKDKVLVPTEGRSSRRVTQVSPLVRFGMDSSGRHVLVKAVPESSKEWRIISALMSLNYDPENHTIPIVDVLHRDGTVFIVQAQWHDYPFSRPLNFHQWIVVAYQVLEGLAFMHRQGIGHGEILCATTMARLHIQSLKTAAFESHSSASGPQSNVEEKLVPSLIRNSSPHPFRTDSLSRRVTDLFARDVYALGQIIRAIAPVTVPACYAAVLSQMTSADPNIRPSARVALALLTAAIEDAGVEGDSPSK